MARYLDPKADLTFKRIFGQHPELLISFLNAVMPFEADRYIVSVEYLPVELMPETPGSKFSIVDVRCIDNYKRQFIVEIQTRWYEAFMKRIVFNAGKTYVRQLGKGNEYELLQPVYTLSILTKNFDHKTDSFYHHFQIINRENSDEIIPGLEFILIELTEKFRPETIAERKLMALWLRFLNEVNEDMRALPVEMQENAHILQAAELCEIGAYTPAELAGYDKFWDTVSVERTIVSGAMAEGEAIGVKKGKAIGLEEGKAIGLEEGKAIGLEEGKAIGEHETANNFALNALQMGISIDDVSKLTGLSVEQIHNLKSP